MKINLALGQIAPRLGDVEFNVNLHIEQIQQAIQEGRELIIFPELGLTGYGLQDLTLDVARRVDDAAIQRIVAQSDQIDIVFSFVEETPLHTFTISAIYASGGTIVHLHRKVYLPTYGLFDEMRYFGRGEQVRAFSTRFGKIGLIICEDAWHPMMSNILAMDGATMMIVIAAGPARGMQEHSLGSESSWHQMLSTYASLYGMYVAFVNRVGVEDGVSFFGRSAVFDPEGERIAVGPYWEEARVDASVDFRKVRRARYATPIIRDEDIALVLREWQRIQHQRSQSLVLKEDAK